MKKQESDATTTFYECLDCNELYRDKDDAINCCNRSEEETGYKCTKCDEMYTEESEANDCCDNEKVEEKEVN